jgi:predicted nucleotidyltransferase
MAGTLTLTDILIEQWREKERYFRNYRRYAAEIKKAARERLGKNVRVLVFGSILRDEVPRDIDILIISSKLKDTAAKSRLRAAIWQKIGVMNPCEIHLVTDKEYDEWYKNLIKEDYVEI